VGGGAENGNDPLYPGGDSRGRELLGRLGHLDAARARHAVIDEPAALAAHRKLGAPNVDFGIGALAFAAEMVPGAAQAISVVGRMTGWLAHALEEYASPTPFRSRAIFVGRPPGA